MSRSRRSRSSKKEEEADVVYEVQTNFHKLDSKILLIEKENDQIEVIAGNLPIPQKYDTARNHPDLLDNNETRHAYAAADWIVEDAKDMLSDWDLKTSSSKSNNPYYNLRDVYFVCNINEVDEAVMTVKEFILHLERKRWKHAEKFDLAVTSKPSENFR